MFEQMSRILILTAVAYVAVCCAASADARSMKSPDRRSAGNRTEQKALPKIDVFMERVSETLKLTPEQQEEIRPVLDSHLKSMAAVRERARSSFSRSEMQEMRYAVQKLELDTRLKLCRILNAEQMASFDALMAEHKPNTENRRGTRGTGNGMRGMGGRGKSGSGPMPW